MKIKYAVILLLFLGSCSKVDLPTQESGKIVGEWEWVESRGGLSGDDVLTPETQSETRELEFKENGKYRDCIDGDTERGKYSLEVKSNSQGDYLSIYLDGKSFAAKSRLTFSGQDTMSLFPEDCADCFVTTYARK
ncbi:MAG: hypothetical protein HOI49_11275 [Bacteroidetes bacterium]|jgi:hypothetical protein|nr:hypothetical protein [Bacteroidota bacterium]MDA8930254.1 hypothetical protein [Bacteroidia bacterium]